jgi:hypothetical protein
MAGIVAWKWLKINHEVDEFHPPLFRRKKTVHLFVVGFPAHRKAEVKDPVASTEGEGEGEGEGKWMSNRFHPHSAAVSCDCFGKLRWPEGAVLVHFAISTFIVAGKELALFIATVESEEVRGGSQVRAGGGDPVAFWPFGFVGGQYAVISPDALPVSETELSGVF